MISGRTRLFVLLGRPVAHSCSPAMQNAAFQALGLDAVYAALDCAPEETFALATAIAGAGGGGNATVPHKTVLAAALEGPTARVERLGSANVFWGEGGRLMGDSTDLDGVLEALRALEALKRGPWLVAGTGGSARAIIGAAAECGTTVAVRSRTAERAKKFADWAASVGVQAAEPSACEVLINATPLGLAAGDPLPLSPGEFPKAKAALDLVYHRGETAWVTACRAAGLRAADGREMLVAQGAASLERWFPKARAPREVMRAAVARALA
ncbi:MAG TPA: shikimate dehydrogenase [Gemmatimonadales bacterium]|nr:shikimate dehydrogenase [Gemmatimonadales bacterium]